jgi:hypothetical protein
LEVHRQSVALAVVNRVLRGIAFSASKVLQLRLPDSLCWVSIAPAGGTTAGTFRTSKGNTNRFSPVAAGVVRFLLEVEAFLWDCVCVFVPLQLTNQIMSGP